MEVTILLTENIEQRPVRETNNNRVWPLVDQIASEQDLTFSSLLDVGSSDRPAVDWFLRYKRSRDPHRYAAVEIDPIKIEALQARKLTVVTDISTIDDPYDLTVALEVIEHIRQEDSLGFLQSCARSTKKLFALTTPNFEYWRNFRALGEYRECRWIPDHAIDFKPGSDNPHAHQQEMTADNLYYYMSRAFPSPEWEVFIYRAWPWELKDLSKDSQPFTMFFKLFALARKLVD